MKKSSELYEICSKYQLYYFMQCNKVSESPCVECAASSELMLKAYKFGAVVGH